MMFRAHMLHKYCRICILEKCKTSDTQDNLTPFLKCCDMFASDCARIVANLLFKSYGINLEQH